MPAYGKLHFASHIMQAGRHASIHHCVCVCVLFMDMKRHLTN